MLIEKFISEPYKQVCRVKVVQSFEISAYLDQRFIKEHWSRCALFALQIRHCKKILQATNYSTLVLRENLMIIYILQMHVHIKLHLIGILTCFLL